MMSTQLGCNDTDGGKSEYWEGNLPQHNSVLYKSHLTRPRFEPGPPQRDHDNFYKFSSHRAENII
jgi:hypothetical protein